MKTFRNIDWVGLLLYGVAIVMMIAGLNLLAYLS